MLFNGEMMPIRRKTSLIQSNMSFEEHERTVFADLEIEYGRSMEFREMWITTPSFLSSPMINCN